MWPRKKKVKIPVPDKIPEIDKEILALKKQIAASDKYDESLENLPKKATKFDHIKKAGRMDKIKDRLWPERSLLINMEMRNGMHNYFIINTKNNYFKYAGGTFVIDPQLKYFVVSARTYALDYHQDCSIPIKREIPIKAIEKTIKHSGLTDVESATNPSTLEAFIEGKVIEQLMKAQAIDEFFKKIDMKTWIILLLVALNFILIIYTSGMLKNAGSIF